MSDLTINRCEFSTNGRSYVDDDDDDGGCQFDDPPETLVEFDGKFWCEKHLPMLGSDGRKSPKAYWNEDRIDKFNNQIIELINQNEKDFTGVVFPGEVDFTGMTLCEINFELTYFHGFAEFQDAQFEGTCFFQGAFFNDEVSFMNSRFFSHATFDNAYFGSHAYFSFSSLQEHEEKFDEIAKFRPVGFENAIFRGKAEFSNRIFTSYAIFTGAIFYQAPKFQGAILHQSTEFPNASGFKDTSSKLAYQSYRTLKLAMETTRARKEQALFFALEQRSTLQKDYGTSLKKYLTFSFLYDITSEYGQNALRPLLLTALTFTVFFAIYYQIFNQFYQPEEVVFKSATHSFKQIVSPFYVWKEKFDAIWPPSYILLIRLLSSIQSTLSLILISLFSLAIRWRFKKS